jgi:hypothetical protein
MDRAGQLHFLFDVEQPLTAGKGARRVPHRKAKTVIPQVNLGQAVELAHPLTGQGDKSFSFGDALAIALEVGFVQTLRYIGLQVIDHLQHEFMAKCLQAKVYFAHPY